MSRKWDKRFLDLGLEVASWSKDPSTKVGAVIVDDERRIVSVGYNGLPRSMEDSPDILNNREVKYKFTVHAEMNAILNSALSVKGCTLLVTHPPCVNCATQIIQAGIKRVVFIRNDEFFDRWGSKDAVRAFQMSGVQIDFIDYNQEEK